MRKPNTPLTNGKRLLVNINGIELAVTKKTALSIFYGDVHKAVWYVIRQIEIEGVDGYAGTFMGISVNIQVLN